MRSKLQCASWLRPSEPAAVISSHRHTISRRTSLQRTLLPCIRHYNPRYEQQFGLWLFRKLSTNVDYSSGGQQAMKHAPVLLVIDVGGTNTICETYDLEGSEL